METGKMIMKYLENHGISQAFLSKEARIAPAKLSLSLNGKRKLTFEEYSNICWVLGVSVDTFIKPRPPQ